MMFALGFPLNLIENNMLMQSGLLHKLSKRI